MLAAAFADFDDPNPSPGNQFGQTVVALSTGNVVVTSPRDDYGGTDAGAVYLFNGATGALISTLRGSHDGDNVGKQGVTALANGNYVVRSAFWDSNGAADVGAATWGNGTTGVKGVVSATNSLVGSTAGDRVGLNSVTALTNGNYVVKSSTWDNGAATDAGAVTFGSGTVGVKGVVTAANSLVGGTANDQVGGFVVAALINGNYVVISPGWDNGAATDAGAVTWGSGTTGVKGTISAANSLVGSTTGDQAGSIGMLQLTNGNYVVVSPDWDNGAATDAGAATWGSGTAGVKGAISAANSLVGSSANDRVSGGGGFVAQLTNGNYVVISPNWDNGASTDAGAATWGSGTAGVKGVISAANSLVGSTADDQVGEGGVTALTNGNYVVNSRRWDNGATANVGAATWGNGTVGVKGTISAANSLVGSTAGDSIGASLVMALTNGNYVVSSPDWDNGAATNVGAVTWGSGTAGVKGVVSAANSLVGSTVGDSIGFGLVLALTNGNYVVRSPNWNNGAATNAGAVTWGSGTAGIKGVVSAANSLVGSTANDMVGRGDVTALTNGNYVVTSPDWDNGAATNAGAATWGSGTSGVTGTIDAANSLVGITTDDQVGGGDVRALTNGNYVVISHVWNNGAATDAGAVTWGSGTVGIQGVVSAANSLIGSTANDSVGFCGVTTLTNGNYVVRSPFWDNGAAADAGAATWGSGTTGVSGTINSRNSALGTVANANLQQIVADDVNNTFYARFFDEGGGSVRVGSQFNGFQPAPQIGSFGGAISFTENAAAILISSTATVSDADSPNLSQGELRINLKSGGSADDRLRIRTQGTGTGQINVQGSQVRYGTIVLGTFSGGVGTAPLVVKLNSQASAFRVQQLLRNITFSNVSENPATATRTLRVTLSDDDGYVSNPVFKKIDVAAVNDAPVLSLGGTIGYVHDSPAITLAGGAIVSDVDSANFSGGRLRVRITDGASGSNRLSIGSGFSVDANNNVLQGSTIIGKRVSNGFGTNELIITFNTSATPARVQALVRAITFKTVGGAAGQRKVIFTVSDGDGGVSQEAVKTVNVS
jgi:hypothetical protein